MIGLDWAPFWQHFDSICKRAFPHSFNGARHSREKPLTSPVRRYPTLIMVTPGAGGCTRREVNRRSGYLTIPSSGRI